MIWVEKVVAVHDNSFVGVYVGESKYYYATKAASHRDKEGSECIISKYFLSEGLCRADHTSAIKLFTVQYNRREGQTDAEFRKQADIVSVGYKMYARQHFYNCIYSNYGSKYVLSKDEKQSVREALQKSSFAQYYSEKLQQALTYENWKESVKGQQAVVAKRGTLPATVTSEDNLLPVKKPRLSEENPPHNVVQMIKEASQQYGRQALREILDKFSQEEKKKLI